MNFIKSHPSFDDTIDSLKNEFKNDKSNDIIICGAHDLSKYQDILEYKKKYNRVIVFNQEQLLSKQRNFMHINYFKWIKLADEVWDYDEKNLEVLKKIRSDVKIHLLKPYKNWPKSHNKDIDILFYGYINDRRKKILDNLSKKYKVVIPNKVYGDNLDDYILRSKILLNIHYYECAMQEQARMIRWINSPCRIISETSWKNYLGVEEMDYEKIYNL